MGNTITYQKVLSLINNINSFAEESDQKIAQLWNSHKKSKAGLENQFVNFMTQATKERDDGISATKKKAMSMRESAEKIYKEVLALDASLAETDKYYVKTRDKKAEELAQKTDASFEGELDIFVALEKVKVQYQSISSKYSEDTLPAVVDGVIYIFSKQRKADYEELIVLKNTLEGLMDEIKITIPELISDTTQMFTEKYNEQTAAIKSKYQTEVSKVDARYEQNAETLADEICQRLDIILPDNLLRTLRHLNESYNKNFTNISINYGAWDKTITFGCVDYPLELFVSSKILFSLIADKCSPILVHKKHLRFPLICSLDDGLGLIAKHTHDGLRDKLINSVMQGFLASVPVARLDFSVVDSENQGRSILPFAEMYKKLPKLFGDEILTSHEVISEKLEDLTSHIDECSRYKLGSSYKNIFEYANDNPIDTPQVKVLVIFDSPQTLGNKNAALINNLLENGGSCGVYVIIAASLQTSQAGSLPHYHEKGCLVVNQAVDMFMFYGLRLIYNEALEGSQMSKFVNRYLLSHDSICGNVAMLNADMCRLMTSESLDDAHEIVSLDRKMQDKYINSFGIVSASGNYFPSGIPVGSISVPSELISDNDVAEYLRTEMIGSNFETIELPAMFNLAGKNNLFVSCPEVIHPQIAKFVHNLMWSFLSFTPVSRVNFCIFDAERRGKSVTPFLDFRQSLPEIFDSEIFTTQDAMTSRLQKLNGYIDDFIQEKLGNRYGNIVEYNTENPKRTEAVTVLIIFDFPRNFDSRSLELLQNILSNGGKCGIYTILCHNPNVSFSRYESIDEHLTAIKEHCSIIEYVDKKYVLLPYELTINIAPELSGEKSEKFIKQYIEENETAKRRGLSFEDAIQPPFFTSSTAQRLSIPLGIGDGAEVAHLVIGEGSSHHGIIAGATGSGKSTLLHTIIMSGMLNHSPDELHLYLMDFKSGTEFKVYESARLPHIQLLALDGMQEFGESILEELVTEMLRRGDLFKNAGQSSLKGYVSTTGNSLPRILVIMDEFQVLYNDSANRKVAMNCAELTKRIVTEGRAFGIHLMMATQTTKVISDLTLSHAIIEQMRVRIGLKCGEDDVRYLFSDRNDTKALEMMKGPIGTAVMNLEYMESNNIGFRAAYCSDQAQARYLSLIADKFADKPSNIRIFEGNRVVSILEHLRQNEIGTTDAPTIQVHLGHLIKVAPPFFMQFDRRRRHNVLICGANESMAENLTNIFMLSALLNTDTDIMCIDGESLIGESASAQFYECFANFSPRFKEAKDRAEVVGFVNDLYSVYSDRKKSDDLRQNLVIIKNMQFLDIIKKMFRGETVDEAEFAVSSSPSEDSYGNQAFNFGSDTDYSMSSLSVTEKLLELIENGSSYGIFFVVSSLEYQSVKENMYYGENVLAKFPERIIFALSNNDADNLIDGVAVSGLRDNTVFFTDGIKSTFQLKPYIMSNVSETRGFLGEIVMGSDVQ